jgi:hypothetical protein
MLTSVLTSQPSFEFNSVLPNLVMGAIMDKESQAGSSAGFVQSLFDGTSDMLKSFPPRTSLSPSALAFSLPAHPDLFLLHSEHYVNAQDTGLIHLGALTLPSVAGQRLWAAAAPYTLNEILAIFRKLYPSRTFPEDSEPSQDLTLIDRSKGEAILRQLGQEGWQSLEVSIEQIVGRE